jgi:hypothetical protein
MFWIDPQLCLLVTVLAAHPAGMVYARHVLLWWGQSPALTTLLTLLLPPRLHSCRLAATDPKATAIAVAAAGAQAHMTASPSGSAASTPRTSEGHGGSRLRGHNTQAAPGSVRWVVASALLRADHRWGLTC